MSFHALELSLKTITASATMLKIILAHFSNVNVPVDFVLVRYAKLKKKSTTSQLKEVKQNLKVLLYLTSVPTL